MSFWVACGRDGRVGAAAGWSDEGHGELRGGSGQGRLDLVGVDVEVGDAVELLATVIGQDLEAGDDGVFRIARKVAKDRVISTVDPDTRHGHQTRTRGFDDRGHVAVDPDSEIITDTPSPQATPGTPPSPPT